MSEFPHLQIVIDAVKSDLKCSDEEALQHAVLGTASLARAAGVKVPAEVSPEVMEEILAVHGLKLEEFTNKARLPEKKSAAKPRRVARPRKNKFV